MDDVGFIEVNGAHPPTYLEMRALLEKPFNQDGQIVSYWKNDILHHCNIRKFDSLDEMKAIHKDLGGVSLTNLARPIDKFTRTSATSTSRHFLALELGKQGYFTNLEELARNSRYLFLKEELKNGNGSPMGEHPITHFYTSILADLINGVKKVYELSNNTIVSFQLKDIYVVHKGPELEDELEASLWTSV